MRDRVRVHRVETRDNIDAPLMYGEVGTKAFCRTEPFEGKKFFMGSFGAEGWRATKGHGCIVIALYFVMLDALSSSKRYEEDDGLCCALIRVKPSSHQAVGEPGKLWHCALLKWSILLRIEFGGAMENIFALQANTGSSPSSLPISYLEQPILLLIHRPLLTPRLHLLSRLR